MKKVVVASTTHIDRHNTRMTKEALESAAAQINSGRKPVLTMEHDVTLPPIGKILHAWIEPTEDGEYQLLTQQEIFEKEERVILPNGLQGLQRQSDTDNHPFVDKIANITERVNISADPANFTSFQAYEVFLNELQTDSPLPFESGEIARKAHIPDPEIIITISQSIIQYLVTKKIIETLSDKVLDKLSDKISDDITDFYTLVKSTAFKYAKYALPKNRPITYIFNIYDEPHVELVIRTTEPSEVAPSIMVDNLEKPLKQAQEFRHTLGAERVQFLLDDKGEWKFNYLLTDKGRVIGTKKSFSRKARQFDLAPPSNLLNGTKKPRVPKKSK